MSDPVSLLGFLNTIAMPIGKALLQKKIESLLKLTPFEQALRDTDKAFKDLEGVRQNLTRWIESESFNRLVVSVYQGDNSLQDDGVVTLFIENSGFFAGEATFEQATKVVTLFLQSLRSHLLRSADSSIVLSAQMASLEENILGAIAANEMRDRALQSETLAIVKSIQENIQDASHIKTAWDPAIEGAKADIEKGHLSAAKASLNALLLLARAA